MRQQLTPDAALEAFFFLRHYFKRRNVTKTITTVTLEGGAMWCLSKIFNYLQSCSQCSEKWGSGNLSNLPKFTKLDRIRVGSNSCLWLCLIRLLYKISCEETVLQKWWRTEEKRNSLAKQILTSQEYLRLRHVTSRHVTSRLPQAYLTTRHITSTTGVPHVTPIYVTSRHVYFKVTSRHVCLRLFTSTSPLATPGTFCTSIAPPM